MLRQYFQAYLPKKYLIENPKGGKYSPEIIRSFLKQSCERFKPDAAPGATNLIQTHQTV
jgi:hypothetical protein